MDIVSDLKVLSDKADGLKSSSLEEERLRKWFNILYDEATLIVNGSEATAKVSETNLCEFVSGVQKKQINERKRSSFLKKERLHDGRRSSRRIANKQVLEEKANMEVSVQSPLSEVEVMSQDSVQEVPVLNGTFVCSNPEFCNGYVSQDDGNNVKTPQCPKETLTEKMCRTKIIKSSVYSTPSSGSLQRSAINVQPSKSKLLNLTPPKNLSSLKSISILKENQMERSEKQGSFAKIQKVSAADPKKLKIEENKKKRELRVQQNQEQRLKVEQEKEKSRTRLRAKEAEKVSAAKKILDAKKPKNEVAVINKPAVVQSSLSDKKVKDAESNPKMSKAEPTSNGKAIKVSGPTSSASNLPTPINKQIQKVIATASNSHEKRNGKSPVTSSPETSFISYDISEIKTDSEDEEDTRKRPKKRVPTWASGLRLQNAVVSQMYHPIDTDQLFGSDIEISELGEIMGVKKMTYKTRTSSAIWNTTFTECF